MTAIIPAIIPIDSGIEAESELINPYYDPSIASKVSRSVGTALFRTLNSAEFTDELHDNRSFFVCDLGQVYRLFEYWVFKLPRVHPYYAVKCNPDLQILKLLAKLGANFDCASQDEMQLILKMGVDASRIIFSNPCKYNSHLNYAKKQMVDLSVFDNEDELEKIAKIHPNCRILLRIATDDRSAFVRLSMKYGAQMSDVSRLLTKAKMLGLSVAGVHFHCGSGTSDLSAIAKAVTDAKTVFERGKALGFNMSILDIGGGWMINNNFDAACEVLNRELDAYFPAASNVTIISEPGRFFPTTAFTLASNIIGKRGSFHDAISPMLYVNDGIYANMNCIINDHYTPIPKVLSFKGKFCFFDELRKPEEKYSASCWGQTCDSADIITNKAYLSHPVGVNDWLFFTDMGAYTLSATTDFNGFNRRSKIIYISSDERVSI